MWQVHLCVIVCGGLKSEIWQQTALLMIVDQISIFHHGGKLYVHRWQLCQAAFPLQQGTWETILGWQQGGGDVAVAWCWCCCNVCRRSILTVRRSLWSRSAAMTCAMLHVRHSTQLRISSALLATWSNAAAWIESLFVRFCSATVLNTCGVKIWENTTRQLRELMLC